MCGLSWGTDDVPTNRTTLYINLRLYRPKTIVVTVWEQSPTMLSETILLPGVVGTPSGRRTGLVGEELSSGLTDE